MTQLHVYNTLTRQKEAFKPIEEDHVRMYVCGPTVYDYAHIGNARPVVVFDTLYRLLQRHYKKVTYARNITDVDDKILARAKESKISIRELTTSTTKIFHKDMWELNALSPTAEPRATDYIGQMIKIAETLIKNGHAYEAEGHVLFSVSTMPDYGKLSHRSRDELIAGARVEVAPYKKDPADFVLWKPAPAGDEGWESPWGHGRPGWHLECSAMADDLLGDTFDIHGGGLDLIFPHHENEIAQSSCAHGGAKPANYWMHNGFLTVNGEKMSKSLGNFFTVHDLLNEAPGEAIRLTLLAAHYRQPCDFSKEALVTAKSMLDKWYGALRRAADIKIVKDAAPVPEALEAALLDDLNTPLAITELHDLASKLNRAESDEDKASAKAALLAGGKALGLLLQNPQEWMKGISGDQDLSEAEIEAMISARAQAKVEKNFELSDNIRGELAAKGIILEDSAQGTIWRRS